MGTARFYQADRNVEQAVLPGVPLGDIDDQTWARFPQWVRDSVDAWTVDGSKVYRKTHRAPPEPEPAEDVNPPIEALQPEEDAEPATEDAPPDVPEEPPDNTPSDDPDMEVTP
jgi:hypothetical protein